MLPEAENINMYGICIITTLLQQFVEAEAKG